MTSVHSSAEAGSAIAPWLRSNISLRPTFPQPAGNYIFTFQSWISLPLQWYITPNANTEHPCVIKMRDDQLWSYWLRQSDTNNRLKAQCSSYWSIFHCDELWMNWIDELIHCVFIEQALPTLNFFCTCLLRKEADAQKHLEHERCFWDEEEAEGILSHSTTDFQGSLSASKFRKSFPYSLLLGLCSFLIVPFTV